MTSATSLFGTNKAAETEGVEIDYGSFGITVTRAGDANPKYKARREALMRPHRRQVQNNTLPDEVLENVTMTLMTEVVVIGWRGHLFDDQKDPKVAPPCTVEKKKELFELLPDLYADITAQALSFKTFSEAELEGDVKS